jgi:ferredoxin
MAGAASADCLVRFAAPRPSGRLLMKIRVDPDKCQGHARCYGLAPEIFDVDDYGLASVIVDVVPPELEEKARLAVANCPEYAIEIISE